MRGQSVLTVFLLAGALFIVAALVVLLGELPPSTVEKEQAESCEEVLSRQCLLDGEWDPFYVPNPLSIRSCYALKFDENACDAYNGNGNPRECDGVYGDPDCISCGKNPEGGVLSCDSTTSSSTSSSSTSSTATDVSTTLGDSSTTSSVTSSTDSTSSTSSTSTSSTSTTSTTLPAGASAWWTFDEYNATHALDASGGAHAAFVGGNSSTLISSGYSGSALFSNGTGPRYALAAHGPSLQPSSAFTLMAWMRSPAGLPLGMPPQWFGGIMKGTPTSRDYGFGWNGWSDGWGADFYDTSNVRHLCEAHNIPVLAGQWYHVAEVYDGQYLHVYLNGSRIALCNVGAFAVRNSGHPLSIGGISNAHWNGQIDDVRFYPRALSGGEIDAFSSPGSMVHYERKAQSADAFVDFIGINVHLGYTVAPPGDLGGYAYPTPYIHYDSIIKPRLLELGVRHIRDGYLLTNATIQQRFQDLHASGGIRTTFVVWGAYVSPPQVVARTKSIGAAVEAIEGPNEWDHKTPDPLIAQKTIDFTRDLHGFMRNDSYTASIPIRSATCVTYANCSLIGVLSQYVDVASVHTYAGPSVPGYLVLDHDLGNLTVAFPGKPIAVTEMGWHTSSAPMSVTPAVQSKYLLRRHFELFNRNVIASQGYELIDGGLNASEKEHNFGILYYDGSPKPAFTSLKNMIALLKESGASFSTGTLGYSIAGSASVRHALLQKSNGEFYLVLWNEVYSVDADATETIALSFDSPFSSAVVYAPHSSASAISTHANPGTLFLSVPDHPLIVRLIP